MSKMKACPQCGGSGAESTGDGLKDCSKCGGTGSVKQKAHDQLSEDQRQTLGGAGGAAMGFAAAGPAGALVGGVLGLVLASEDNEDGAAKKQF